MSIFNDDRSTMNPTATAFDQILSESGFDVALQKAFESGMNLDEIIKLPVVYYHYKKYGWVNNLTDR